jgi:hypothetical protein
MQKYYVCKMKSFVDNVFGIFFKPQGAKENTFLNKEDKFTVAVFYGLLKTWLLGFQKISKYTNSKPRNNISLTLS